MSNVNRFTTEGLTAQAYNVRQEKRLRIRVTGRTAAPVVDEEGRHGPGVGPLLSPRQQMIGDALVSFSPETPSAEVEIWESELAGIEAMVEKDTEALELAEKMALRKMKRFIFNKVNTKLETPDELSDDWREWPPAARDFMGRANISAAAFFTSQQERGPQPFQSVEVLEEVKRKPVTPDERQAMQLAEAIGGNVGGGGLTTKQITELGKAIGESIASNMKAGKK